MCLLQVTQPIKYAKHKNSRRVCLTILLVWAISAAIGSPIVLGLNNTPDREHDLCAFYNSDFIIYSSLSSFYIPCIIMVFLYWNIFKVRNPRWNIVYCEVRGWQQITIIYFITLYNKLKVTVVKLKFIYFFKISLLLPLPRSTS